MVVNDDEKREFGIQTREKKNKCMANTDGLLCISIVVEYNSF